MATPTKEQEEAFRSLQATFKEMAEQQELEIAEQKAIARTGFFGAIPEDATSLYIHLSHKISQNHPFVRQLQTSYGADNVLVTVAPERSGQSFYDNHLDKIAEAEKRKRVIEPYENFSSRKGIDAVIYLCRYLCDGYQDPYFPDQVETQWHVWHPIRLAEQLQKPLIVGYQDGFCFGVECYEREYIGNSQKIKCQTRAVKI